MVEVPRPRFRRFAHALAERGIDLFHGHSAHLCQAVELCDGHLILYDSGDFLDDYAVDPVQRNDRSFVFLVEADAAGPRRLRMLPVRLHFARVELATGREFEAIRERMLGLCAAFATPVTATEEGLEIAIPH
jgi:poly-gamma-glutamate synthesis protein (capsule biosynthesis protein)